MAKFVFKLQSVLNIKKQIEDSLKIQLGKAVQALEAEKELLKELESEKKRCMGEVGSKVSGGVKVDKLKNYNAYISFIKQKISRQYEMVKSAQEIVDKYREELTGMMKERKMLEKLREKQYEEYMQEIKKKEQKDIDEIVSYRGSARNGG